MIVSDKFNKEDIKKARAQYRMDEARDEIMMQKKRQHYVRLTQQTEDVIAHTKSANSLVNLIK